MQQEIQPPLQIYLRSFCFARNLLCSEEELYKVNKPEKYPLPKGSGNVFFGEATLPRYK